MKAFLFSLLLVTEIASAGEFKIHDYSSDIHETKLALLVNEDSGQDIETIFQSVTLDGQSLIIEVRGEPSTTFVDGFKEFDFKNYLSVYKRYKVAPLDYSKEFDQIRKDLNKSIEETSLISSIRNEAKSHGYQYVKLSHEKFSLDLPLFINIEFEKKPNKKRNEMVGSDEPPIRYTLTR